MGANQEPRLLVDSTAGRLARWLRIAGFDTEYATALDAPGLARLARQSGRRMVTRSGSLARRLGSQAIHLASGRLEDQLRQVLRETGAVRPGAFSRCNICNRELTELPRESVAGRVPAYVFSHNERFSTCPGCGRYYWQGTHYRHMLEALKAALEDKSHG